MSNENGPILPTTKSASSTEFPVAAIVSLALGGYIILIAIILIIRQCLVKRGFCAECNICGKEGELQCCECCLFIAESSNCCSNPSITACLDAICPNRKQVDFVDVVLCQCCAGAGGKNICSLANCDCDCGCQPGCKTCNFLCFQVNFGNPAEDNMQVA